MKRFLPGLTFVLLASAYAAETPPEPPIDSNPTGMLVFAALFVGFCVVFAWMVWRNKDKDKKQDGNPQP
jgi:hypothetical protein